MILRSRQAAEAQAELVIFNLIKKDLENMLMMKIEARVATFV